MSSSAAAAAEVRADAAVLTEQEKSEISSCIDNARRSLREGDRVATQMNLRRALIASGRQHQPLTALKDTPAFKELVEIFNVAQRVQKGQLPFQLLRQRTKELTAQLGAEIDIENTYTKTAFDETKFDTYVPTAMHRTNHTRTIFVRVLKQLQRSCAECGAPHMHLQGGALAAVHHDHQFDKAHKVHSTKPILAILHEALKCKAKCTECHDQSTMAKGRRKRKPSGSGGARASASASNKKKSKTTQQPLQFLR